MDHDIFISHAHKDKNIADSICNKLESAKLKCWMTPRDILASDDRREATWNAIGSSRAMVLVLSENANAAPHIEREITHAFYTRRTIIAFRLSNTVPRRSFLFYLENASWFDGSGPDAEQHLEALALRVTDLVLRRSVTSNHRLPRVAMKAAPSLRLRDSLIGGLQSSHYRTLNILKRAAIATFVFALLCFLWLRLSQDGELSLVENNLQPIVSRPSDSPDPSSRGTGESPPSKTGLIFTRFGLWESASNSSAPVAQQGSQDALSTSPTGRSGSAPSSRQSDAGRKAEDDAQRLAARDSASLTSAQEHLSQTISLPQRTGTKKRSKGHHGISSESDGSGFAKIKIKRESEESLFAMRPERRDDQDVRQSRQITDAAKQNSALEAELGKPQEENGQLLQHGADIAAFYKSDPNNQFSKDQEDVQAVQEDASLAKPEAGQIQSLNPSYNQVPAASTLPLNPPG